jgi:hypothetical protein
MPRTPFSFWASWAVLFATLGLWFALPRLVAPVPDPWNAAESAVGSFVLAILALVAGIGTFALRESLVMREVREGRIDPGTPAGLAQVRIRLVALWALCSAIGVLGGIMIHWSGRTDTGAPYLVGAAVLLVLHAPTRPFLRHIYEAVTGAPSAPRT